MAVPESDGGQDAGGGEAPSQLLRGAEDPRGFTEGDELTLRLDSNHAAIFAGAPAGNQDTRKETDATRNDSA